MICDVFEIRGDGTLGPRRPATPEELRETLGAAAEEMELATAAARCRFQVVRTGRDETGRKKTIVLFAGTAGQALHLRAACHMPRPDIRCVPSDGRRPRYVTAMHLQLWEAGKLSTSEVEVIYT